MGKNHFTFLWALLASLAAATALAQDQSRMQVRPDTFGLELPGTGPAASQRKTYIVQLREPSAVEHHSTLVGPPRAASLAAGNGVALRSVPFNRDSAEVQSYTRQLAASQDRALARVGPGSEMLHRYSYSLNGFAARMTDVQAEKMAHLPEVLKVWEDEIRPLTTNFSADFLELFDNEDGLRGAEGLSGEDIVIGVIDSGIVLDHPSLKDSRLNGPSICESSWESLSDLSWPVAVSRVQEPARTAALRAARGLARRMPGR